MGEGTRRVIGMIDNIGEIPSREKIMEFVKVLWKCNSRFLEGIKERLIELGHNEEEINNRDTCFNIVESYYRKNKIKVPSSLEGWIVDGIIPGYTGQSRPNVYKLCFALEMNEVQTIDFFARSYFDTPFNWKRAEEAIYFFCLKYNKPYSKAEEIKNKVISNDSKLYICRDFSSENVEYNGETNLVGEDIKNIETEEALLQYISENKKSDIKIGKTVKKEINDLLSEIRKNISAPILDRIRDDDESILVGYAANELVDISENDILSMIYGHNPQKGFKNKSPIEYKDFPKCITDKWPKSMTLSNIEQNKGFYDSRRMLIILNFFNFFTVNDNLESNCAEEFFDETNELLVKCGFNSLYWRNPFDLLFYYCAQEEDPIAVFGYLIDKMHGEEM